MPVSLFKSEYTTLRNIPGVFRRRQRNSASLAPSDTLLSSNTYRRLLDSRDTPEPAQVDGAFQSEEFDADCNAISISLSKSELPTQRLANDLGLDIHEAMTGLSPIHAELYQGQRSNPWSSGSDSFGSYLPWHEYVTNTSTPWGVWLFLEPLLIWAIRLMSVARYYGLQLTSDQAFNVAYIATLRHEIFHYQVECFATHHEVLIRQPIYLPYVDRVYEPCRNKANWLEEALAQSVALSSLSKRKPAGMRRVLAKEYLTFGAGYRDFECKGFGGVAKAHRILAAQVISGQTEPGWLSTTFASPRSVNSEQPGSVPTYLLFRPDVVSRFQKSGPRIPYDQVVTWLERKGFQLDRYSKQSHPVYRHANTHFSVILEKTTDGVLGYNGLEQLARAFGVSQAKLAQAIINNDVLKIPEQVRKNPGPQKAKPLSRRQRKRQAAASKVSKNKINPGRR